MQKRYGFLRTERDVKETKKELDEKLALVMLGYNIGLGLGRFKFWNFDLGSNHWLQSTEHKISQYFEATVVYPPEMSQPCKPGIGTPLASALQIYVPSCCERLLHCFVKVDRAFLTNILPLKKELIKTISNVDTG